MEKIINLLINNWTKGVDTYTHNGSTWLIFTEQKSWVIELTESKTLWYNYNFFRELFSLTSMDVVDNQHYITKWVEENVIGGVRHTSLFDNPSIIDVGNAIKYGVRHTEDMVTNLFVEDTIQNGVKETRLEMNITEGEVDDIILDGVKHTEIGWHQCNNIDDTIKYGVKETHDDAHNHKDRIDGVIKNGVKETLFNQGHKRLTVKNIIENGVRHTLNTEYMPTSMVEDIIQSGVKETKGHGFEQQNIIDDIVKDGVKETNHIKNNVRETKQFEEHLADTIDAVINEGVIETSHRCLLKRDEIEDIIDGGVKETELHKGIRPSAIEDTIQNGVRHTQERIVIKKSIVDDAIENGVKETSSRNLDHFGIGYTLWKTQTVINEGVKETKTPGDGDIVSTVEWMKENNSTSYPKMIDDVIENGEKINGTYVGGKRQKENIEVVIDYGVKKIKSDSSQNPMGKVTDVIKNGVKETKVCNFLDPNTNLVYVRWPEEIDEVIYNGTKNPSV